MAAKSRRHQKKKTAAGASRRSRTSAAARHAAPKTRSSGASKPKAQGAKRRMIAKKTTATPVAKKPAERGTKKIEIRKAPEQARKPVLPARKPAVVKKVETKKPVEVRKLPEVKKPAEAVRRPVEQAKKPVELHAVPKKAPEPQVVAKKTNQRQGFKTTEYIVYPAHGVGQIMAIEEQEVAGYKLELFVISFAKDKMTLRVPTTKVVSVGMRKLAEPAVVKRALETLKGRARVKRTMWSRRAQEYEAKINSGDIVAIAEVVRDLFRSESQPEQSYSERQLYEAALDRLAREIAVVERVTETEAVKEIEAALAKGPRRGPKPAEGEEALVEEAA
ncbi:MAG TPA: CarD family transcriptional regulator [Xanthobacteraceae bacterium]